MRVKSNLKAVLDSKGMSIRQLSAQTELPFESLRRLYNDDTKQYQRDTVGIICKVLNVKLDQILILTSEE